jgi:hypothetical protein
MRAEALQSMRHNFDFLETMMADGEKEWVLESGGPSLADINGIFLPPHAALPKSASVETKS